MVTSRVRLRNSALRLLGVTALAAAAGVACLLSMRQAAAEPLADTKKTKEDTAALKAQLALARKAYLSNYEGLKQTQRVRNVLFQVVKEPEQAYTWSVRWLEAERALSSRREDQIAALEAHLKRMTELRERVAILSKELLPTIKVDEAEWYRLEAQTWLAKVK